MMSSCLQTRGESKKTERQGSCLSYLVNIFSYRHAIDGMVRVAKEEGFVKLFSGADWATGRAVKRQLEVGSYLLFTFCRS